MKQRSLFSLAIMLVAILASCDDSNKDHDRDNFNPKETAEYAMYGVENYQGGQIVSLVGDVKTITASYFGASWKENSDEKGSVVKGSAIAKKILTFDKLGFLTQDAFYDVYESGKEAKIRELIEIKYDSKYRIVEYKLTEYNISQAGTVVKNIDKKIYKYDDKIKEGSWLFYKGTGDNALKLDRSVTLFLDENGRIEEGYFETSYPNNREDLKTVPNVRAMDKVLSTGYTKNVSKDKKGNTILSYDISKETTYRDPNNPKTKISINNYSERVIEYHDGTSSAGGEVEQYIEGGGLVASRLADFDLIGGVKSMKTWSYAIREWNAETQEVEVGGYQQEFFFEFDDKGVLVRSFSNEKSSNGNWESDNDVTYKYDSKYRLTNTVERLYYNNSVAVTYERVITYDDTQKTGTFLFYKTEEGKKTLLNQDVHKLAADGTISLSNVDIYKDNGIVAKMSNDIRVNLSDKPSETIKKRITKDSNGNWIEEHQIEKRLMNGLVKYNVILYGKREITYY